MRIRDPELEQQHSILNMKALEDIQDIVGLCVHHLHDIKLNLKRLSAIHELSKYNHGLMVFLIFSIESQNCLLVCRARLKLLETVCEPWRRYGLVVCQA